MSVKNDNQLGVYVKNVNTVFENVFKNPCYSMYKSSMIVSVKELETTATEP
jgi:hypothetical protein